MANNNDLNAMSSIKNAVLIKLSFLGLWFIVPMTRSQNDCSNSIYCDLEILYILKWTYAGKCKIKKHPDAEILGWILSIYPMQGETQMQK